MPETTIQAVEITWPEGVIARYLTKAAELTGNPEITVDLTKDGIGLAAKCRGCGGEWSNFWAPSVREKSQAHAEACRAIANPNA